MSYTATVINVMMASPDDVEHERKAMRDIIHEWNAVHAADKRLVLMPVGWESHASPRMGQTAQEVINTQILNECDLLVAAFWTRLGTPTGDSPSGTVEEIKKHLETGKPAMIYFSNAPVHPENIDQAQYKALVSFRNESEEKGLIEKYDSLEDFRNKFHRQLTQTVLREFPVVGADREEAPEQAIRPELPALTDEAKLLLLEAAGDGRGEVFRLLTHQGLIVHTLHKQFVDTGNPRSEAKWEAVIKELVRNGLIEDRGTKGEIFAVTHAAYELADRFKE